jgi:hypothetical protein
MPALPLDEAGAYVAAAYAVFVAVLVVYVSIMSRHVSRVREDLRSLQDEVARRRRD